MRCPQCLKEYDPGDPDFPVYLLCGVCLRESLTIEVDKGSAARSACEHAPSGIANLGEVEWCGNCGAVRVVLEHGRAWTLPALHPDLLANAIERTPAGVSNTPRKKPSGRA
jgi:hypothetical protein